MDGTIKRICADKGYMFLRGTDGIERFAHRSSVVGASFEDLREGQAVSFDEETSPKGPRATNVEPQ